jgi:hypothetical protein
MQEMTKIPFFMNFANNVGIKCREICNWSETIQMTWNARKMFFGWLGMQENIDKYTVEKDF